MMGIIYCWALRENVDKQIISHTSPPHVHPLDPREQHGDVAQCCTSQHTACQQVQTFQLSSRVAKLGKESHHGPIADV